MNTKIQYKFSNFYLYFTQFSNLFNPVDRALYIHWLLAEDKLQLQFPQNVLGRQIQATELKLKLNINGFQKGAQFLYRFSSS